MVPWAAAAHRGEGAIVFGGYPDCVHLREEYAEEEPDDLPVGRDFLECGAAGQSSRSVREEQAGLLRGALGEDMTQFRLHYNALLHLVREHFRPEKVAAVSTQSPPSLAAHSVRCCSCQEMQDILVEVGGWRGLEEPVVFAAPSFRKPFVCRADLLQGRIRRDFPTATVLGDGLAAQFGPDWLAEGQTFERCAGEHCFSQVPGVSAGDGPLRELWEALPDWMRCPMVVMSTGPGGSGVAFHKHSSAWLLVLEGTKHWWLYPPGGPPTEAAYHALALCPSAEIAQAVARLPVEDRPLEVTQRPGEALFVPAFWWHATFNTGPTLAVGSQYHVFDLDFSRAVREHQDSAFALYHRGCEIHKSDPKGAAELFELAVLREPLNFYYAMNQLRFYLNLVWPPKQTLDIVERLLRNVRDRLDERRQMLVLRFVVPSLFDFVEWNMAYDRLLKYSHAGCVAGLDAVLRLTRPYLPGGEQACFASSGVPHLEQLRYVSTCAQCGDGGSLGRPGAAHTIWAHKFYCSECFETREAARCVACGSTGGTGQMGHAGTPHARGWYCESCWKAWKRNGVVPPLPPPRHASCAQQAVIAGSSGHPGKSAAAAALTAAAATAAPSAPPPTSDAMYEPDCWDAVD